MFVRSRLKGGTPISLIQAHRTKGGRTGLLVYAGVVVLKQVHSYPLKMHDAVSFRISLTAHRCRYETKKAYRLMVESTRTLLQEQLRCSSRCGDEALLGTLQASLFSGAVQL